jgi:hypothetical protein
MLIFQKENLTIAHITVLKRLYAKEEIIPNTQPTVRGKRRHIEVILELENLGFVTREGHNAFITELGEKAVKEFLGLRF